MSARARSGNIFNPVESPVHDLVNMARDHVMDTVFLRQLLERKTRVPQYDVQQPGRPVRHDKLYRLRLMRLQVLLQKRHFLRLQIIRAAVIEYGEMRRTFIETIVWGMSRVLLKKLLGSVRPDVMVTWRHVERDPAKRLQKMPELGPLALGGRILQPL